MDAAFESIQVLFEKLIGKEEIERVAFIFKEHDAISKGQYNKVHKALNKNDHGKAWQKLLNSLKEKNLKNFEAAVKDKDFPGDEETKDLLLYCTETDNDIHFFIRFWKILEDNLLNVEALLGLESAAGEKDEVQRVRTILVAAMLKFQNDKGEERNALNTIKEFLLDKEQDARSEGTTTEHSRELEDSGRHVKTGDSDETGRGTPQTSGQSDDSPTEQKHDKYSGEVVNGSDKARSETDSKKSGQENTQTRVCTSDEQETLTTGRQAIVRDGNAKHNAESSGPKTRLQTAKAREQSRDESGSLLARECVPMPSDLLDLDEESCILEFRTIIEGDSTLAGNLPLCIETDVLNWKPTPMNFNEKKDYFYYRFLIKKNSRLWLRYKFCAVGNDPVSLSVRTVHERLPNDHFGPYVNREINLIDVKTSNIVFMSVCVFNHNWLYNWTQRCSSHMGAFLPPLGYWNRGTVDEWDTAREIDIFAWINWMKCGWKTDWHHTSQFKPNAMESEGLLLDWLKRLSGSTSGNIEDLKSLILTALTLALALLFEEIKIHRLGLLEQIFKMMRTDKLDVGDLHSLYKTAMEKHTFFKESGLDLPSFLEAMQWLYKSIPTNINVEWMFTLPLYHLLEHGTLRKVIVPKKQKNDLMLSRAALPTIPDFDWIGVKKRCATGSSVRREFLNLAEEILAASVNHPWMINTFQFMLTRRELISMVLNKEENTIVTSFPIECVMHIYLEQRKEVKLSSEEISGCDTFIREQLDSQISATSESDASHDERQGQLDVCVKLLELGNDFLGHSMKHDKRRLKNDEVLWCVSTTAKRAVLWANLLAKDEKDCVKIVEVFKKMVSMVTIGIANKEVKKGEVDYWNKLLVVEWDMGAVGDIWRQQILHEIQNSIKNLCLTGRTGEVNCEKYLDFYVSDLGDMKMHADVEKSFNEKASHCAEELLKTIEKGGMLKKIMKWITRPFKASSSGSEMPRFIEICEKLFVKEYQSCKHGGESSATTSLKFLCGWSFASQFFKIFGQEDFRTFSSELKSIVKEIEVDFKAMVSSLLKKDITVECLNIILRNKENFLSACAVLTPDRESDSSSVDVPKNPIDDVMRSCEKCLESFKWTQSAVDDFIMICNYVEYDAGTPSPVKDLDKKSKASILKRKILDLVGGELDRSYKYFEITQKNLAQFQQLSFLKDSKVFQEKFVKAVTNAIHCAHEVEDIFSWPDVLVAWENLKAELFTLVEAIHNGSITMDVIAVHFKILQGVEDKIEYEVSAFYEFYNKFSVQADNESSLEQAVLTSCKERKTQICNVFQMQQANVAVDVLLRLRDMLQLAGDFSDIAIRKEMVENQKNVKLGQVPCTLRIPEISMVDGEKLKVLKKFMAAEKVIRWLQEKMKDMNEVKVMCDLAMISAGENVVEVDRVSGLLTAVMGFAPLIFWTEEEKKISGQKEMLEECKRVWENATPELLEKWDETSRQLHWFKEVEKFYGSVEKSSLSRAQEINAGGTYRIARRKAGQLPTKEDCILLTLPKKEGADSAQHMNIEQLRELQSKLMLIAGEAEKGREDVNLFIDVLTSVQKLSEAYVDLVSSGCMLFAGWEVEINCCSRGSVARNLKIEVNFTEGSPPMTGFGSHKDLDELTKILKRSLEQWNEHISSKRMEFYHLNEYNIQQIMYLCHELSHIQECGNIHDQVRQLLSFVKKDVTGEELRTRLQEVKDAVNSKHGDVKVDTRDLQTEMESVSDNGTEDLLQQSLFETDAADDAKKKIKAVFTLVAEDKIQERVAKAAVQSEGFTDLAECRTWVLLNEFEEDLIEKYSGEFDIDCGFTPDEEDLEVDHSIFSASSGNTLDDVIAKLRENIAESEDLLKSIKTVCLGYLDETIAMDLQDHLSVGLLGQFLDNLSEKSPISRHLLPQLHQGRPNLLVCAEEEILPTVLTLYMHSSDQPLPSRSEVLVCSEETASDEVERFMRRAMCNCDDKGKPLHALAFADKLSYSTSSVLEDMFHTLLKSKKRDDKYQLVILLSKQQHYLATCFDKHLVDGKWNQSAERIQSYLESQLQVEEADKSAAIVTKGNYMVKVVTSTRSGVGKSLYVQRLKEKLVKTDIESRNVTLRMLENKLNIDYIIKKLQPVSGEVENGDAMLVHVDLTPAVQHGIEAFAFNLFILGSIQGSDGRIWKTHSNHLYVVEMTDFGSTGQKRFLDRHILNLLPSVACHAPYDVLHAKELTGERLGMDQEVFQSETFQRPFQYLSRYQKDADLDMFAYSQPEGTEEECIDVLLRHCCIEDPSWAQLCHFCSFLNVQLKNCEKSVFCTSPHIKQELAGLKVFAVKFMIRMAQDFATPSLEIADKSMKDSSVAIPAGRQDFLRHQIRRRWEELSHPYVFFNEDGQTMTFINVKIDSEGFLLNQSGQRTERFTTAALVAALQRQGLSLATDFDTHPRKDKLRFLRQVLGVREDFDPDPTYELTTDNVLKILAIYMRFRCQIPVIIMGETGCGKTRLVEFMTKLKAGPEEKERNKAANMITLKIHGGITVESIHKSVEEAKKTEIKNRGTHDFTVLFYDEANTTEAIYAIKEVMCDGSINGESFSDSKLQIVAACNPYKKLSDEVIKKLEDSGLGYRIRTSKTAHLFGNIPVRSLVYRVVALPPSMQPFVWDFGQLSDEAEKIYIQQMTRKLAEKLRLSQRAIALINDVLSSCQKYMRQREDECRYVSLRDVERCMTAYEWFHERCGKINEVRERFDKTKGRAIDDEARALIQTVGVCYHASLDNRESFRERLADCFGVEEPSIKAELELCQDVFLRGVKVGENIAINEALRENVFMMAVCADMRIPLFLIGKPGSSKSLAKTIVTGNMQGQASHAPFYRDLKQIHILSYQCSALTDAEGIERVFNQCIQLQKKQNSDTYTAVVVLDEIGLAEDSPNMPLKVLHPLLERRSTDLTTVNHADAERVGFIGISNWALDPAKMNRGIFLTRNKPTEADLIKTGKELVQPKPLWQGNVDVFENLTATFIRIYTKEQKVEYFGLRDYYSLMKMICRRFNLREELRERVSFKDVAYSVLRNFSGGDRSVVEAFVSEVCKLPQYIECSDIPAIPIQEMIKHNLNETESRFLLLLVNQFSVVSLLESCIKDFAEGAQVVFGSSFPDDHSYTEICRNINKIKVCMETGRTVILLNMANIHESLYDALNQHYVTFGGQNYVDLGLGGHRVKCRIAEKFRLIVIEKKDVVSREYPIPLINRLEKHHFTSESLLDEGELVSSKALTDWAEEFSKVGGYFTHHHAFIGFHDDTACSVVLTTAGEDTEEHKEVLVQSCAMDAILRLPCSQLRQNEVEYLQKVYFDKQQHDGLADVIKSNIEQEDYISVLEITSFSGVLSKQDSTQLQSDLGLPESSVLLLTLERFQTQQEYCNHLDQFFELCEKWVDVPRVLLVQCAQAQSRASLVACARHCLMNKVREAKKIIADSGLKVNVTVALLLSTERQGANGNKMDSLALQHTQETQIVYVDELRPTDGYIAPASNFIGKSLGDVFELGRKELENEKRLGSLVSIRFLLIDSVCEAVAMVKGQNSNNERYLVRVEILMQLCEKDGIAGDNFRKILLEKIAKMYSEKGNVEGQMNWIVTRAKDQESLQEGGTFRKTLWLCLKGHLSRFMALVISMIDRCDNLNIIVKEKEVSWELNMWLEMFQQIEIQPQDLTLSEFNIVGHKNQKSCKLPFSFLIIDFLEAQWKALKVHSLDNQESFTQLFRESKINKVATNALEYAKKTVMENFAADVIGSLYKSGAQDEKEICLVQKLLFDLSMKNFRVAREKDDFRKGDEIAIIFVTFKSISKKLEKFSEVIQGFPQVLENSAIWYEKQHESPDFTLHILALKDVLNLLKEMTKNLEEPTACIAWIDVARVVKQMYSSVTSEIVEEGDLKTIQEAWTPFSLLDLLLLQLLPPAHISDELFQRFVRVIAPHAKLFWKGSAKTDPRSYNFMRIVLNVLRRCFLDVQLMLLINWQDWTCRSCMRKVQDPSFLPCEHFTCAHCMEIILRSSETRRPRCPVCNVEIPEAFTPHLATLAGESAKILLSTKSNCTSFFLEYLQQFCFKGMQSDPSRLEQHVKQILKELIVQSDTIDRTELDSTGLDLNINTKSCILRILLGHDENLVTKEMDCCLQSLNAVMKKCMVTVLMKYMEQKLLANSSRHEENKEKLTIFWEKLMRYAFEKLIQDRDSQLNMEMLQNMAKVRCVLGYFVSLVEEKLRKVEYHGNAKSKIEEFTKFCIEFVTSDAMPQSVKDFVIKSGCRKYGKKWLFQVAQQDDLQVLIPPYLRQAAEDSETDYWVLLGLRYVETKAVLYESQTERCLQTMDDILSRTSGDIVPHTLAIACWCFKKPKDLKDEVAAILNQHLGSRNLLRKFLTQHQCQLKFILESNLATKQQVQVLYQLLVLVMTASESQNGIMEGFHRIFTAPQTAHDLFLPAMPEDVYFATPVSYRMENDEQNSMYKCPNGHLYSIGDCTRPYVTAQCPDCKSTIGGKSHKPAVGNVRTVQRAQTQAGYKSSDSNAGVMSTGAERMSPQGAAVVNFILHSCLLAATVENQAAVSSLLPLGGTPEQFLIGQVQKNLQDLSKALARNEDDAILVLLKILLRIIRQGPKRHTENWSSLDARRDWEQTFRRDYLLPAFQDLDQEIEDARAVMRKAEAAETVLSRLIDEVSEDVDLPQKVSWEHPSLWNIVEHSSSAHLLQVLEDGSHTGGEVIQIIVQTPDLHFVKYLENILTLQASLIERYQYDIDMNEAETTTFKSHIEENGHRNEDAIKHYIKAWNQVFPKLCSTAPTTLHGYFEKLSMESPISMALPSTRGRGQCAILLAEYLIEIQNQFLSSCMMVIKPAQRVVEVEVSDLVHTDFVCIDKRRDLLNLINMHTNYSIETDRNGRHHHISYNVEALEKQVREKFVMSKKQIRKNTLPFMKYPQDVGIGSDWQKVRSSIQQEPLTAKLSQNIDRAVARSHSSEVCEGVRTLTNAISFLAMIKTDAAKSLVEFLEKDLKLPSPRTSIIPRSALICHVLSLYQRLCWHKAVIFVKQGLDPYKEALTEPDEIPGELMEKTMEALHHIDVTVLQQRVNEILVTAAGIDNAEWSLTEDVFPNVQFVDKNEDDSWYSKLPNELCVKHIGHLFALTVNFEEDGHTV